MRGLDWNGLQFVLALARHGSLDRASQGLGVDPSTVSRRVRALEGGVGARFFDRTNSGHQPTAVGRMILQTAEQVESSIAAMERLADRADERLEGLIRVVAADAIACRLVPLVASFRRRHPEVAFEIGRDADSSGLVRHDADMAIRFSRPEQAQLASRRITTLGFGLYAAASYLEEHPLTDEASLAGHQLLGFHGTLAHLPEARWLDDRAAGASFALRACGVDPILVAATAGLGLAVLPCCLAEAEPSLVRLLGPDRVIARDVWLVVHRDLRRIARLRAFADFLAAELREQAPQLQGELRAAS